jgi:hypothetical protein
MTQEPETTSPSHPAGPTEQPFGAEKPRPRWPVYLWATGLITWFVILLWMAWQYPARG